jgi:hypothetical protein
VHKVLNYWSEVPKLSRILRHRFISTCSKSQIDDCKLVERSCYWRPTSHSLISGSTSSLIGCRDYVPCQGSGTSPSYKPTPIACGYFYQGIRKWPFRRRLRRPLRLATSQRLLATAAAISNNDVAVTATDCCRYFYHYSGWFYNWCLC